MLILSIDTATKVMGVAVATENALIAEASLNVGKTHSERLLPLLASLLDNAELSLEQMDAIAVTNGPGSFTGLRIGLATVKALASAAQKPIIPICTLDALAFNARNMADLICPVLDARKSQLYAAVYDSNADRQEEPQAITVLELAEKLQTKTGTVMFLGDGAELAYPVFQEKLGGRALLMPKARRMFMAASICELAVKKAEAGEFMAPAGLKAFYLRASGAKLRKCQSAEL